MSPESKMHRAAESGIKWGRIGESPHLDKLLGPVILIGVRSVEQVAGQHSHHCISFGLEVDGRVSAEQGAQCLIVNKYILLAGNHVICAMIVIGKQQNGQRMGMYNACTSIT